jgi:hypothetical protein
VGPRKLRLVIAGLCAIAIACAPKRAANVAPAPTAPTARSVASPAPEPPVDLDPEGALGREPTEGVILVRTSVLRGHPVGVHVGPIFGWWRGWRSTLRSITRDPVADLDWLVIVGPTDPTGQRMLARVAAGAPDAAIDGRLVALQARSAEPAESHVEGRIPAAAARLDGTMRVVFRPQKRFVAAAAMARGPGLSHVLSGAHLLDPQAEASEAVRFDVIHPQDALRLLPAGIRRVRGRILALGGGDADASAEGDCDDPQAASNAAAALRDAVAGQYSALIRMLTHGLLDGLTVASDGPRVKIHLHATRDQLDTVFSLLAAMAPTEAGP